MSRNAFEKIQDVYDRYLQYYELKAEDKEALSRNKFVRYLKHDWIEISNKQKKINGEPVLCFVNVRLKPYSGKTEEPAPKDEGPVTNNSKDADYSNAPPEDEIPF
jgi:hypothetical protein